MFFGIIIERERDTHHDAKLLNLIYPSHSMGCSFLVTGSPSEPTLRQPHGARVIDRVYLSRAQRHRGRGECVRFGDWILRR